MRSNRNRAGSVEEYICNTVEQMSTCVQELHPTCLGFVKRQAPFVVESFRQILEREYDGKEMPSCVEEFLQQAPEEEGDFPAFNQLVDELVLIKAILNNRQN